MHLQNQTILITGGSEGIGFELARLLSEQGNTVIICGRTQSKLTSAKERCPELHTIACDVSVAAEREHLVSQMIEQFPSWNVLINNAGIQYYLDFTSSVSVEKIENELATNLAAPFHFSSLVYEHFNKQPAAAIMNVTSGLAFVPRSLMPIYCATKAALHSFTETLRVQFRNTKIEVIEIVPPIVDTDLDKGERDKRGITDKGISAVECAKIAIELINSGKEIALVERAERMYQGSLDPEKTFFKMMNGLMPRG